MSSKRGTCKAYCLARDNEERARKYCEKGKECKNYNRAQFLARKYSEKILKEVERNIC